MPASAPAQFAPGQPLPAQPSFPVRWERSAQAHQLWALDRQHFGRPLLPLAADVWRCQATAGTNRAMAQYHMPIRLEMLAINHYLYNCYQPMALPPAPILKALNALGRATPALLRAIRRKVAEGMAARYMPQIALAIGNLETLWSHEWLPEIRQHLAFWHSFDLSRSSESALAAHLSASLGRIERLWELHFVILIPAFIAASQFEDLHTQLLGAGDHSSDLTIHQLLRGADTSFLRADRALWQLSRQVHTLPVVREALEHLPAHQIEVALHGCAEGQIFLAELHAWLNRFGMRGHGSDGLGDASYLEDPSPVIRHLQALLQQPDLDLEAEYQLQAAERARAVEQARVRLAGQPAGAREHYLSALRSAQFAAFLSTEHNFWIDQQAMVCLRRVFLELGRRRAANGRLDRAEDILFLSVDEVRVLASAAPAPDQRAVVAARAASLEQARALNPPGFLGTVPLMAPPPEDPFARAMARVLGDDAFGPSSRSTAGAPFQLKGQPAAAGVARGRACVLRGLNEGGRLRPGDILVAEATLPAWTPLFAIAGAVVTAVGGTLSHAATTAREYGIPAVVGLRDATTLIQSDQLVEVNGGTGVVRVIDRLE